MTSQRVFITEDPYWQDFSSLSWQDAGKWPTSWIRHPALPPAPYAVAYRKTVALAEAATIRAHITADERYELFIDGERVAMGSERGDANNWFYETFDFSLKAGTHTIVCIVSTVGEERAYAQMTVAHGFLFSPQSQAHQEILGTGISTWDAKIIGGLEWIGQLSAWGTGRNLKIHGADYPWGIEGGAGEAGTGWVTAEARKGAVDGSHFNEGIGLHFLRPGQLPPMLDEMRHAGTVRLVSEIPALQTSRIAV